MSLRIGLALAVLLGIAPRQASATEPSGTVSGHAVVGAGSLISAEPELGGGGFVDLLFGGGPLRLGPALGTYFVNDAGGGRVITPLALASSIRVEPRPVGATFRARLGFAPGATGEGFSASGIFTGGVYLDFRIDDVISLGVGSDVSFLFGGSGRTDFMPGVLLSFTPRTTP